MKALQIVRYGVPPEVVELFDLSEPGAPGSSEVLVAVEYAPINLSEILKILGRYPILPSSFPAPAGNEGVARILAVGKGVKGLKPGDRVLVPFTHGSWSERLLLPATGLFALPANADPRQLSMLSINPPTAALMLSEYADLQAGDWVLQNAGNSGVGRSVIAIAKSRDLHTVSIVRRAELVEELLAYGADVVLLEGPDLLARIAAATKSASIKLAIDGVAGESGAFLAGAVAPGGTVVVYSYLSRKPVTANGADIVLRDVAVRGFWLYAPKMRQSPKIADGIKLGARLVAEGKLSAPVAATYPLSQHAAALAHALKGGKVLFEIARSDI
jgi:NADPH:quinone reductase-like Zn-dependent oxidoreductase